jgi:N-acetylglucosaminyldiphosphoundecaprenol N-acetyl-beta-D-mannosaminyltransferase
VTLTASIVVATYNRPDALQRLLGGLAEQTVAPIEIVVVDDGSEPAAAPVVPPNLGAELRLLRQANGGPGAARHHGIQKAVGDVIVLVDDDMIVPPTFVAGHLARHEVGNQVVQARFDEDLDRRQLFERFTGGQHRAYFDRCAADERAVLPEKLTTGNVSFRRDQYLDVGGFDLSLRRCEDREIGVRFAAAGARFGFAPEATTVHDEAPESIRRWLKVAYEYGQAEVAIAARYPEFFDAWSMLRQMPAPVRLAVRLTMRAPSTMRPLGNVVARCGALLERLTLQRPAVRTYGLAYAFHWFAGAVDGHGGGHAARRSLRASADAPHVEGTRTRVLFGGVAVDVVDMDEAVERAIELANGDRPGIVVTPNVDHLMLYRKQPVFAAVYDKADLVLADGQPMVMLSKLLRLPLRHKVSGSDLLQPLMAAAAKADVPVYMLGSSDETTATAAQRLTEAHSGLRVVGRSSPMFRFGEENSEIGEAVEQIRASGARLVMVAFGAPKQEQLLAQFADRLPPGCYVCCGASLDFAAEKVSRAPEWVSKSGFEWLYRLAKEPRRLWKRYLVQDIGALPLFLRMIARRLTGRPLVRTDVSSV